jgi:hypothetical protein
MRSPARLLIAWGCLLALAPAVSAEGPEGLGLSLRGEGRVVAIDRARGWVTVEHRAIEDLFVAGQTDFPVQSGDALERVRVDDRVAFTLTAPREGHGELSISELRVLGREAREPLGAGLTSRTLEMALVAALLLAVIALLALQTRRLRQLIQGSEATIAGLREQIRLQRDMSASVEQAASALLPALRDHQSELRQLGQQLRAARTAPREESRAAPEASRPIVIVRSGETETFRVLDERLGRPGLARVVWDRRRRERRSTSQATDPDRRRRERRAPVPVTWQGLGYFLVQPKVRRLSVVA